MYNQAGPSSFQQTIPIGSSTPGSGLRVGIGREARHDPCPQGAHSPRLGRQAARGTVMPIGRQKPEGEKEAMPMSARLQWGIGDVSCQTTIFSQFVRDITGAKSRSGRGTELERKIRRVFLEFFWQELGSLICIKTSEDRHTSVKELRDLGKKVKA